MFVHLKTGNSLEMRLNSKEIYEFSSFDAKKLTLNVDKGKTKKINLTGSYEEVNINGGDVELFTTLFECSRLNINNSSIAVKKGGIGKVENITLKNSKFTFQLPGLKNLETFEVKERLILVDSNLVLNDASLKAESLDLKNDSRVFCETVFSENVKITLSEIFEDETSYLVLPKQRRRVEVEGVQLY